ncbi:Soluble epoxide hydrolase [Ephemeroptericola cinctiostellae]|uniref:Soluble epoxide hydrolase n=1 Tax=Ephemeroptericola cinctiostellae TaxID=2268024 RepID=A0A345D7Y9_9BURK|nr:alpha/beta hydrolase [Ephemeroptericola cinctiostellae]AXF84477.1 Soluble epoxide hydrolase [Ephemeroptericola cinctiostellae]
MLMLPATKLYEIGDTTFEYVTAGVGEPSVVLINGSGGPMEGWHRVFSALSETTTTFAYNRPGLGRSTKPLHPQTSGVMVEDLRNLLLAVSVPRPWVLVGHSFGGLVANHFARLHPNDIAGIVMLEATAPDDVSHLKLYENALQRSFAWVANHLFPLNPNHETLHALKSVSEIACAPDFPLLPLRILTGTKPAMAWATNSEMLALRAKHQESLAGLSPLGVQLQASKSGHFPQFTEPNLVISAIQELVAAAH